MNLVDWVVLLGTMLGIATYGSWRTRQVKSLSTYLKGSRSIGWGTIGLSVMATQASAITFLSIPGQGFESGIGFVQNYFGLPLALVIVCAVFLPIYRRLGVYTAYEFLGRRFDDFRLPPLPTPSNHLGPIEIFWQSDRADADGNAMGHRCCRLLRRGAQLIETRGLVGGASCKSER